MTTNQQEKRSVLGKISGILKEFNKLAVAYGLGIGTLTRSLPNSPAIKAASPSQEGLLGSLILEQILTPIFTSIMENISTTNTSQGSLVGLVATWDIHSADRHAADQRNKAANDDSRFKKGAGKGSEALIFSPAKSTGMTSPSGLLNTIRDGGRGFFTSPFNSRAHKRLESALAQASQEWMALEAKFA
ncbi:MAG TPA: hypothetical protein PLO23_00240 [Alphaproteobacteria bacterium]|nr:hypothetical protein [Alphaproteobacteria bacterium]